MIKYPLEIEFTNNCSLECITCISKNTKNKGFLSVSNFNLILNFIKLNRKNIDYITIGGIGDIFLHPNIIKFLDKFKDLSGYNISILIPTKGITLTENIILKLLELKKEGFKINIQIGFFSLSTTTQNIMSGLLSIKNHNLKYDYFSKFKTTIKLLKKYRFDFALELLLTKYSENEIDKFYKFCNKLEVDGVVHRLHNFGGKLNNYNLLLSTNKNYNAFHCSFDASTKNIKEDYYNDKCGFFPFLNWEGKIYPGTFCKHYYIGNIKDYNYHGGMKKIIKNCYNKIDFNNNFCRICTDNNKNIL